MAIIQMNFNSIFQQVIERFPSQIDISDGVEHIETSGFSSNNLTTAWEKAESQVSGSADDYLVWAIYKVLHSKAKELFQDGKVMLDVKGIAKDEFEKEYRVVLSEAEPVLSGLAFCCKMMAAQINQKCDHHDSKLDCPDSIIDVDENGKKYKILIHDGGSSGIEIKYCPWCGKRLNK